MSVFAQPLFEPVTLTPAPVAYYTAGQATSVDKLTAVNTDTLEHAVTVNWVPAGGAVLPGNVIVPALIVPPKSPLDLWPLIGHILAAGDKIFAMADVGALVNLFGSGRVFGA